MKINAAVCAVLCSSAFYDIHGTIMATGGQLVPGLAVCEEYLSKSPMVLGAAILEHPRWPQAVSNSTALLQS